MNKNALKYVLSFGAGAVVALGVCIAEGIFSFSSQEDIASSLSDGTFVAAVLLLGAGVLAFVGGLGVFDGLTYSVRQSFRLHWPSSRYEEEDYHAYKKRREGKKAKTGHLFISGGVYLAIALLALFFYYC